MAGETLPLELEEKIKLLPEDAPERKLLAELMRRVSQRRLSRYLPYGHPDTLSPDGAEWKRRHQAGEWWAWSNKPWQYEFHQAGKTNAQRLLMAANGVGKTLTGGAETAMHLTGQYPDWWDGHRFDRNILVWVGSISNQTQRDYTQPALFGENLGDALGTGFIPGDAMAGKPRIRQAGIGDVVDIAHIKHVSGKNSTVVMKTYEQGWRMWQGAAPDVVWMDEQPDENAKDEKAIFSEVITRIFRSGGIMYATLTPLLGETNMIRHFLSSEIKGVYYQGATWDDAPHLNQEEKDRAAATYGEHEVEARTQGVPMMGEGRVWSIPESDFKVPPRPIPDHWARLVGIDFGVDHPAGVAEIAWDRDEDVLYIIRTWRRSGADVPTHVEAIRGEEPWIPVAWPHDGLKREPSVDKGLKTIKQMYVENGAKMLSQSARYKNDVGGGQPVEPIILEMAERLRDGGLKVFDTCHEFFDEYRSYHRKDGKIVPIRDDVIKSAMYAIMMRRFAKPRQLRRRTARKSAYTRAVL